MKMYTYNIHIYSYTQEYGEYEVYEEYSHGCFKGYTLSTPRWLVSSLAATQVEDTPTQVLMSEQSLGLGAAAENVSLILVSAEFSGEESKEILSAGLDVDLGGRSARLVVDAVMVELYDTQGGSNELFQVEDAPLPIFLRLSDVTPNPSWKCVFLDGDTWSTRGVRLAREEELRASYGASFNTSGTWCATSHLSIFSVLAATQLFLVAPSYIATPWSSNCINKS